MFRLFDIWKPYPIDSLQNLPAGIGVCADDILAGVYAGAILSIIYTISLSFSLELSEKNLPLNINLNYNEVMIYHILNGDALAGGFDLDGEIIICREAFIEGDLQADSQEDFWNVRSEFIKEGYDGDSYFEKVKSEFDKLDNLQPADEVNLWFGDEAFCQVNLWFCLQLLMDKNAELFRVFPDSDDWDCSFHDLKECARSRQTLTEEDLQLGKKLWQAFSSQDFEALKELGETDSECFPRLREVCQALIEKTSKPKEILQEIVQDGEKDFGKIFLQFRERASIYGFGDSQVKNLLETI